MIPGGAQQFNPYPVANGAPSRPQMPQFASSTQFNPQNMSGTFAGMHINKPAPDASSQHYPAAAAATALQPSFPLRAPTALSSAPAPAAGLQLQRPSLPSFVKSSTNQDGQTSQTVHQYANGPPQQQQFRAPQPALNFACATGPSSADQQTALSGAPQVSQHQPSQLNGLPISHSQAPPQYAVGSYQQSNASTFPQQTQIQSQFPATSQSPSQNPQRFSNSQFTAPVRSNPSPQQQYFGQPPQQFQSGQVNQIASQPYQPQQIQQFATAPQNPNPINPLQTTFARPSTQVTSGGGYPGSLQNNAPVFSGLPSGQQMQRPGVPPGLPGMVPPQPTYGVINSSGQPTMQPPMQNGYNPNFQSQASSFPLPPGQGGPPLMGQQPPLYGGMPGMQLPPGSVGGMAMGPGPYMDPTGKKPVAAGGLTNDALPSVIDVLEKDVAAHIDRETNRMTEYQSVCRSILPPLVTTKCLSIDYGNTVPELLRSSMYVAPCTPNLLKDSGVPFVLHMQPMAELPPGTNPIPIVNHGEKGPVRCNRCKAYMSPYMKFTDGGRKFQCPFCFVSTEVPQEYFAYLDSEGRRTDIRQRPELCLGSYEFLATKEYCRHEKLPESPAFIFMIDVSYRAVSSGFVQLVCQMLKNELESLLPLEPTGEESKLRIGIGTFSDSVNFFNLKSKLTKPCMMTVNDFSDMFVPLVDGFLVRCEESGKMLDAILDYIPKIFADSRQTDTILFPAIQAGMRALEAAGCPGKVFVFNFSLPVFDAPGKLKNREDRQLLGTDKEKTLLKPQIADYTELAKECVSVGCSVDLFLFPNSYIDTATVGEVAKLSGGQVYKYAYFQADKDGQRFLWDLRHNLKRTIAFDAVMRVRTSSGIRPTDYFGNMLMPNTSEVHLASVDSEKVILAEIKHDDKLEDKSIVHIQVALLYTSLSAQRRVRVMNMALVASSEFGEMYRCAEVDVIMNFMLKNSIKGLFEFSPAAIREGLSERTTKMLVTYRKQCSSQTPSGQLVLPESLKLLPVYTNCLMRSDVISGTGAEVGADDRSWLIYHANSMSVEHTTAFLYPRFYVLNDPDQVQDQFPGSADAFRQIRCSREKMLDNRAYLLENGVSMFLWLGSQLDSSWVEAVFGVPNVAQVDIEKGDGALVGHNNPTADRLKRFIDRTRSSRPIFMRLTLIRQRDKLEPWFFRFLVEDKGPNNLQQSYVEFIYSLYKCILEELDK